MVSYERLDWSAFQMRHERDYKYGGRVALSYKEEEDHNDNLCSYNLSNLEC